MTKGAEIAIAACAPSPRGPDAGPSAEDIAQAAGAATHGLHAGFTCGLAYAGRAPHPRQQRVRWVPTLVHRTTDTRCIGENAPLIPPGFAWVSDCDRGCRRQRLLIPIAVGARSPRPVPPARGTACGFKEACNNSGERCLGFDGNVSCPAGWNATDRQRPRGANGCGFVWCEYQDPATCARPSPAS